MARTKKRRNLNALQPGYQLHWYEIREILGQGGFGITYLARDTNLNQQVAIKEFFPSDIAIRCDDMSVQAKTHADADQYKWGLDRFRSEAQTLARFDHPNIIRIFTVFEANHTAYMVMSYEEGESLQEILNQRETLEEKELLNILIPILGGLEKVHAQGFIHRDIKPANLFLRADGSPVLLDFGSARQALGVQTKTLTSVVSPGYAPFEQYYSKSDSQGPWTDIYGLGATMYRAVTGTPPMDAMDRSRVVLKGEKDKFFPALLIGQGRYSERFLRAIDHALEFRAEDRPRTISEWKREIGVIDEIPTEPKQSRTRPSVKPAADEGPTEIKPSHARTSIKPAADEGPTEIKQIHTRPSGKPLPEPEESHPHPQLQASLPEQPRKYAYRFGTVPKVMALLVVVAVLAWFFRDNLFTSERTVKIQGLLQEAQVDFAALRLTQPENDNALQDYRQVLELDPENEEARQGIGRIADQLVELARRDTAANDLQRAESYLDEAAAIAPAAPNLQFARSELDLKKAAQEQAAAEEKARQEQEQARLREAEAAAARKKAEEEKQKAAAAEAKLKEETRQKEEAIRIEVEKRLAEEQKKLAAAEQTKKQQEEAVAKPTEEEKRQAGEKKTEVEKPAAVTTRQVQETTTQQQNLPALEIGKSCKFRLQYKDQGSGGERDVAIYDPRPDTGFRSIGSYAQGNYETPNGCVAVVKSLVERLPNGKPPFAYPAGYDLIWEDKNSGADMDGSIWQPRSPDSDYVCLGSVGQRGYERPNITDYACVHKCLVQTVAPPSAPIWTDAGTGAAAQITIYQLPVSQVITASPGRNSPASLADLNPTGMCQ